MSRRQILTPDYQEYQQGCDIYIENIKKILILHTCSITFNQQLNVLLLSVEKISTFYITQKAINATKKNINMKEISHILVFTN